MSKDNGIYILRTKAENGNQYRVIQTKAIEKLWDSYIERDRIDSVVPTRIVECFGDTNYTSDANDALDIAVELLHKEGYCEYGIELINVDKSWIEIVKEAIILAYKEIEAIKSRHIIFEMDCLEELENIARM